MSNYVRAFQGNSYIFITMVTYERNPILIKKIKLLKNSFKETKNRFRFEIYGIVILPDHIHMLIMPEKVEEYPRIIWAIKYNFSKNIRKGKVENVKEHLTESKIKKNEKGVWQRRYWEHTIRDEDDLYKHLEYIHYNPVKHGYVNNVKDWEFSSFDKFVSKGFYDKNWGCTDDIKHIKNINLE